MINTIFILLFVIWIGIANGLHIPSGFFLALSVYCLSIMVIKALAYFVREAAKAHARRILTITPPETDREAIE